MTQGFNQDFGVIVLKIEKSFGASLYPSSQLMAEGGNLTDVPRWVASIEWQSHPNAFIATVVVLQPSKYKHMHISSSFRSQLNFHLLWEHSLTFQCKVYSTNNIQQIHEYLPSIRPFHGTQYSNK